METSAFVIFFCHANTKKIMSKHTTKTNYLPRRDEIVELDLPDAKGKFIVENIERKFYIEGNESVQEIKIYLAKLT